MEWIPVSERLPEPYQHVLVTTEALHYDNAPIEYIVKEKAFGGIVDFIAWMPLPKPYCSESERCAVCVETGTKWCADCTENGGRYNYFKVR
jgi:hypothetical protein